MSKILCPLPLTHFLLSLWRIKIRGHFPPSVRQTLGSRCEFLIPQNQKDCRIRLKQRRNGAPSGPGAADAPKLMPTGKRRSFFSPSSNGVSPSAGGLMAQICFHVIVPGQRLEERLPGSAGQPKKMTKLRIHIVDDEPLARSRVRAFLDSNSLVVVSGEFGK